MMPLAAALFAVAAVAFLAHARRGLPLAGAIATGLAATVAAVRAFGIANGLIIALVAVTGAASVLVLVIPPREQLARPLALACSALGAAAAAGAWLA